MDFFFFSTCVSCVLGWDSPWEDDKYIFNLHSHHCLQEILVIRVGNDCNSLINFSHGFKISQSLISPCCLCCLRGIAGIERKQSQVMSSSPTLLPQPTHNPVGVSPTLCFLFLLLLLSSSFLPFSLFVFYSYHQSRFGKKFSILSFSKHKQMQTPSNKSSFHNLFFESGR